jgi:formiminotetrahydrofolate cyclodeaminase
MSAALGSSMGAMVANLTLSKKGYEGCQEEVERLLGFMSGGIEEIKRLTHDDMDAFDRLLMAYRLPRGTEEEKEHRRREIQRHTVHAAMVPLQISELAKNLLEHNRRLSEIGNGSVVNDCAVASILLESAARAAMLSVDVNWPNGADTRVREDIKKKRDRILEEAKRIMEESLSIVASRDKTI